MEEFNKISYLRNHARDRKQEISEAIQFYKENNYFGAIASSLHELCYWNGYLDGVNQTSEIFADNIEEDIKEKIEKTFSKEDKDVKKCEDV